MQEILESETMTTVALASEKIIARNKIFRVAGPFLLSVLAFKCKVLFKSRQISTNPSVPYCSSFSSLSPFLALRYPSPLIPFVFHSLSPITLPLSPLRFDILYPTFFSSSSPVSHAAQLRRPWDKRLHFLIFKCAQTSYPAIVCPTEALPRRGFRADKPFQPSMHACLQRCCILPLFSRLLSISSLSLFFVETLPRFPSLFLLVSWTVQLCGVGPRCGSSRWKMQIARATVMKS